MSPSLRRLFAVLGLLALQAAHAQDSNLVELDLATLMTMDVIITSAAKHAQPSSSAAAAVYVITREDIRRSGATTVPQLLRFVPGLQVARITTRAWSVTARGFGTRFANKLLVMVDGRSVYNALFSGVMWEEQPVALDNIERIEVVRGPGGALWGMNAVNGVINIITRNAADAPGLYVEAGGGSTESGALVRHAGQVEALGSYRAYLGAAGIDSYDSHNTPLERKQAGVRLDRPALDGDLLLSADYSDNDFSDYDGMFDSSYPRYAQTGNALVNWKRAAAPGEFEVLGFYEWVDRSQPGSWDESTSGLEAQFSAARRSGHLWSVGAGWRRVADEQRGTIPSLNLTESQSVRAQWSVYAQDEMLSRNDALRLIIGAKLEEFEHTGLAVQPTLRGLWKYNEAHSFWAAASRALRTPSRFEMHSNVESYIAPSPPTYYVLVGDEQLQEEQLDAYEIGWRWRATATLSLDAAAYRNSYSHLIGALSAPPLFDVGPPPRLFAPRWYYANMMDATTHGVELATEWQVTPRLRLQASGSWSEVDTTSAEPGANLTTAIGRIDPQTSAGVRARMDLLRNVELDLSWRYVNALPGLKVASYDAVDLRAAWRATDAIELSCAVENAFGGRHIEFNDEIGGGFGVTLERTYFLRLVWRSAE